MLKCKVCGFEFEAKSENRYTSRSGGRDGLFSAAMSAPDERIYDTFDCPACGCQYVAQERNYAVFTPRREEENNEKAEDVSGDEEKT